MRVEITYEIWEHGGEAKGLSDGASRRIVGPNTVAHEYPSEAAAKDACRQMCSSNFPDTAHTTREYIINTRAL